MLQIKHEEKLKVNLLDDQQSKTQVLNSVKSISVVLYKYVYADEITLRF